MALYDKPECPVNDFDRDWIDKALIWFEQKLGNDFIRNKEHFIPAHWKFRYQYFNSQEAIQYFIEFICEYIGLDVSLIEFHLFWNETTEPLEEFETDIEYSSFINEYELSAEGKYGIIIDEDKLKDFDGTFLRLVYKLTYIKLLHQKVFAFENVYMINYAMVLHGFGIPMANAFIRTQQWRGFNYSAWSTKRFGLLNHPMYGYFFAVLSNYKENDEFLKEYLCSDVQNFYAQACRYLEEKLVGDAQLKRNSISVKDEEVFFEKFFYEDGGVYLIAHIVNKKYEGLASFYHKNGFLWSERIYKNGTPYTVLSNYNSFDEEVEKGTLFEGNGTLYNYKPDGNLEKIETYKDGVKIDTKIVNIS